jgi:hypothetical protein
VVVAVEVVAAAITVVLQAEEALRALNRSILPPSPVPVETMAEHTPTLSNYYVA